MKIRSFNRTKYVLHRLLLATKASEICGPRRSLCLLPMTHNDKFGLAAQTPEQRAKVLARMQDIFPYLKKKIIPAIQSIYDRYIAGELSWSEVRQALDAKK